MRVFAFFLFSGSIWRHYFKKSFPSSDKLSGIGGGSLLFAILNNAAIGFENNPHGGYPVAISITKHPTLQISAFLIKINTIKITFPIYPILSLLEPSN